jgi:hypothetical protein
MGYVVYTPDGRMITTISVRNREPIGGDLLAAPTAARADAFGTFIAYSGAFRVDGDEVIHLVEMSLYPDWIGTEQRRHVELDGARSRLTLSPGHLRAAGRDVRHRLDWERLTD